MSDIKVITTVQRRRRWTPGNGKLNSYHHGKQKSHGNGKRNSHLDGK